MAINTVVNTNMMALTAHRNLGTVGNRQAKANQRLSSGKKINSAADDAAGLAISEKMKAQIKGLDMASKNSEDAISLIQTAEGSLTEVNNMLNRVRELTVQAANDTNQQSDRVKIGEEVAALMTEIDSIAERTEFNEKKLNDGSFRDGHFQIGANGGQSLDVSIGNMNVKGIGLDGIMETFGVEGGGEGAYLDITARTADGKSIDADFKDATKYSTKINLSTNTDKDKDITATIDYVDKNGNVKSFELKAFQLGTNSQMKDAKNDILNQLKGTELEELFDITGGDGITPANSLDLTFTAKEAGKTQARILGINVSTSQTGKTTTSTVSSTTEGEDAHNEYDLSQIDKGTTLTIGGKTYRYVDDTGIVDKNSDFKDEAGLKELLAKDGIRGISKAGDGSDSKFISTKKGYRISADKVSNDGKTYSDALKTIDKALESVTVQRSKLGANQNRLEYTIKNLNLSSENLNAARSRIEDTDMAKEMMNLTQANVLQQAATSILAQANQAPNNITQLLG